MTKMNIAIILLLFFTQTVFCGEFTFELPDNEKQCFFEDITEGVESSIEFQVVSGGNYDVDMQLQSPSGELLYKDVKKQSDTFKWTASKTGAYSFCFSNEFSTFSHKVVYFVFASGKEPTFRGLQGPEKSHGSLTSLERSAQKIHDALRLNIAYQTHFRLREKHGRVFAEDLHEHVLVWSAGQLLVLFIVSFGQVCVLRSFFSDKKSNVGI